MFIYGTYKKFLLKNWTCFGLDKSGDEETGWVSVLILLLFIIPFCNNVSFSFFAFYSPELEVPHYNFFHAQS